MFGNKELLNKLINVINDGNYSICDAVDTTRLLARAYAEKKEKFLAEKEKMISAKELQDIDSISERMVIEGKLPADF